MLKGGIERVVSIKNNYHDNKIRTHSFLKKKAKIKCKKQSTKENKQIARRKKKQETKSKKQNARSKIHMTP